ncbi:cytochrome b/b6 domain-containing protein [Roseospira navarrensis]|uniref:Cytochrome B n=1 Tax=Roseospira navarrensis TaxID=140058 RepID=A0A7X2D1Z1_9PROT|nr:cytochrome b/b6 domain-containing protein [Roseospira navarrensis]MQX35213.1 cytochrome B [Roseospira navarrensis]
MSTASADPTTSDSDPTPNGRTVRVWDPVVRIGHWVLVAGFLICYLTEGEPEWLHNWSGYAVAAVVVLRIVWGVVGTKHARFSDFVRGPGAALEYLKGTVSGAGKRYLGHNPAAGLMALALLTSIGITAFTGMAMIAEEGRGPLASFIGPQAAVEMQVVSPALADDDEHEYGEHGEGGEGAGEGAGEQWEEIHELFANITLGLMVLHILGVLVSSMAHNENLVRAMIDGRKRAS